MNNIDDMPPKCHDCPYWEVCQIQGRKEET